MEIEDLLGVDGRTTSRLGLRGILYGTGRLARTIKATVMGTHRANRGAGTRKSASPKVQCPVPSAPQTYRVTLATSMVEVVRVGPGGLPVEVQGAAQSPKTNAGTTPAGLSGRRLAQPRRDGPLSNARFHRSRVWFWWANVTSKKPCLVERWSRGINSSPD
jgi:hypothetical protein